MIKDALSVLPTQPVIYIAPLVAVVVLSLYYWSRYADCAHDRQFRIAFIQRVHSVDRSMPIRLADLTDFHWDKLRIIKQFKPGERVMGCPFSWDWSASERRSMLAAGRLGALIFFHQDRLVESIDIRNDQMIFDAVDRSLTPNTAVFDVRGGPTTVASAIRFELVD